MKTTLPIACELFDSYWTRLLEMGDRIGTRGDDGPAYYISAGGKDRPDFASGVVQFMNPDGTDGGAFSASEFLGRLTHRETDYSYAGKTSYKGQVIRANSLARINMFERMGTPLAEKYLKRFQSDFGRPTHQLLLYDLARGIKLVSMPLNGPSGYWKNPWSPLKRPFPTRSGTEKDMATERALKVAAQRYISPKKVDMELEHAVGREVPCV